MFHVLLCRGSFFSMLYASEARCDLTEALDHGVIIFDMQDDGSRQVILHYSVQVTAEDPSGLFQTFDTNGAAKRCVPDDPYGESAWFRFTVLPDGSVENFGMNSNDFNDRQEYALLTPQSNAALSEHIRFQCGFGNDLFAQQSEEAFQLLE